MGDPAEELSRVRALGGNFPVPEGIRLRFSGRDAFRYLNGQVTRDLKRLQVGEVIQACLLNPKGKLIAEVLIHREGEDLIVESDQGVGEALLQRLERYLVADEVEIVPEPWPPRIHCFAGEKEGDCVDSQKGIHDMRVRRLGVSGKDVPAQEAAISGQVSPSVVEILRIERGIPAWGRELTPETLPPEAGLDRTHIDYDRGCYPGQEVISRLRSIGRVNRILHGLRGEGLAGGARICDAAGKGIGVITSAASLPGTAACVALGYLPRGTGMEDPLFSEHPLTRERTQLSISSVFGS
jgi:folate-binding protein YgfZ